MFVHKFFMNKKFRPPTGFSRLIPDFCLDYEYAIRFRMCIIILELLAAQVGKNSVKFHTYIVHESCMDFLCRFLYNQTKLYSVCGW